MKLLHLDLIAVGPFTDVTLDFSGGEHGVHLVYGPNEAGKSSSLRALHSLLYGFHPQTPDNFLHSYDKLLVGGEFTSSDGTTLSCIRKKGRKETLLNRGRQPIEEQQLARMLDGVDKEQFSQRFGIDHDELRAGCEALLKSQGDLAELLFAAGSGLADVHRVIDAIRDESREIYVRNGSKQKIPQAKARWHDARTELAECGESAAVWKQRRDELAELESRRETIQQEVESISAELARLDRIQLALVPIGEREHKLAILEELAGTPVLPSDFEVRRIETVTELSSLQSQRETLATEIEKLEADLAECPDAGAEMEFEAEIKSLQGECHSYLRDSEDREQLTEELSQFDRESRELLREMGKGQLSFEEAAELHIDKLRRERIRKLTAEQQQAERECAGVDDDLRKLAAELERLEQAAADDQLPSTESLAALIREIRSAGDLERELEEAKTLAASSRRELEQLESGLPLWKDSSEALAAVKVPATETVRRFERELDEAKSEWGALETRLIETAELLESLGSEISELEQRHNVPTESDLAAAREAREKSWREIRRRWLNERAEAADQSPRADDDLAEQFEQESHQADLSSDRLRREAEHVAAKAERIARREKLLAQQARLNDQHTAADTRRREVEAAWKACWREAGIEPLSPREMLDWLGARDAVIATANESARRTDLVDRLAGRIESYRQRLGESLRNIDCEIGDSLSLESMLREADVAIDRIETERDRRQTVREDLQRARQMHEKAATKRDQLSRAADQAAEAWREELTGFDVPQSTTAEEAAALLDLVDDFFRIRAKADDRAARIAGIDARGEAFKATARGLAERIDPDMLTQPAEEITRRLESRLAAAREAAQKKTNLQQQVEKQRQQQKGVTADIDARERTLVQLCREAECDIADQLPAVAEKSRQLREARAELERIETQLAGIARGVPLAEFLAAIKQEDADRISVEIDRLAAERDARSAESDELLRRITSLSDQIQAAANEDRAVLAAENVKAELARISVHTEDYARLKLAESVLALAIQRYQERHQGPILSRASEYFATLTEGSFARLKSQWSEGDHPVLVGIRAGSEESVRIQEMSSGSMDQLYLALRLAALEHHLKNREPIPLVVDDILIHFDDQRSAAALRALAKMSRTTQVIMFTHHRHLVDLAKRTLDRETLFVQELEGRGTTRRRQRSLLA